MYNYITTMLNLIAVFLFLITIGAVIMGVVFAYIACFYRYPLATIGITLIAWSFYRVIFKI